MTEADLLTFLLRVLAAVVGITIGVTVGLILGWRWLKRELKSRYGFED